MGTVPSIAPMVKKDIKKLGAAQQVWGWGWGVKYPKMVIGLETLAHEERLKGFGSFSLVKVRAQGDSIPAFQC